MVPHRIFQDFRACPNHRNKAGGSLLAAIGGSLLLSACGGGDSDRSNLAGSAGACESFDCKALLVDVADKVVTPAMEEFETKAATLESAVTSWGADQNNTALKSDAQDA